MRTLFAHRFLPGQYRHLAAALAAGGDDCAFIHVEPGEAPRGVRCVRVAAPRTATAATHHYLQGLENAVLLGQAAYRAAVELRREGFRPDVICAHAGFGPGLYLGDAFPGVPILGYFEWFYRARGSDADFTDPLAIGADDELRIRTRNAGLLLELSSCARGVVPTAFQLAQFPTEYRDKLVELHDGVDVRGFAPASVAPSALDLPGVDESSELVLYATRGLETYRGFPEFMSAIALLQARRPRLHAIVLGEDRSFYGRPPADGRGWKDVMIERLPALDHARLHFLGMRPLAEYRRIVQAAHVQVYLTVPFVLSWSLIEAMACGAAIVGSDTPPVREVIEHGRNGLLAPFADSRGLAAQIETLLVDRAAARDLGARARAIACERYALDRLLPRQIALLREIAGVPQVTAARRTARR